MSFKKFGDNDVIINTMRAYPHSEFTIFDGNVYYNQRPDEIGTRNTRKRNVANGFISLYELNIDRPSGSVPSHYYIGPSADPEEGEPDTRIVDNGRVYPFISKDSAGASFKTVGAVSYNNEFQYGDILTGEYPLKATITRNYIPNPTVAGSLVADYAAIRNTLDYHKLTSEHYAITSSNGDGTGWNKDIQSIGFIHIPSIFYGSKIKPGSVKLELYYTGTLAAAVSDSNENGELLQYSASDATTYNNKVAGVVLYDEGIIALTGSWALNNKLAVQDTTVLTNDNPKWKYFGVGANDGATRTLLGSAYGNLSYKMSFKGVTDTQVMTMFARAKKGEVNYSNNPSFIKHNQTKIFNTSSTIYQENDNLQLVNFVSSSYKDYNAPFKRQVYISKIGIYDKNKNLIAVASLASPLLKQDDDDVSFKLKLDI